MIGVLGIAISLIVMRVAQNIFTIFVSRAVGGTITAATLPTAMAYISDSTTYDERGEGMGVIGAALGVGMVLGMNNAFQSLGRVIGPLWAGSLIDFQITLPYMSAAIIMLVTFAYSLFAMRTEEADVVEPQPTPVTGRIGDD